MEPVIKMDRDILELLSEKIDMKKKSVEELLKMSMNEIREGIKELGKEPFDSNAKNEIEHNTNSEFIGKNIYYYRSVKSTNLIAKFLAPDVPDGSVIISKIQTKGKGRSGKKYESPDGGIWLSLILKPNIAPQKAPLLTLATAVAVTHTLEKLNIKAEIKWPNDVLINEKKVCGILTESIAKFNQLETIIIGVGINSKIDINDFPNDIKENSISLQDVADNEISNEKIIGQFFEEFEKTYNEFIDENYENIFYEWRKHSHTIGKMVEIKQPLGKVLVGYAIGINEEGALIIEKPNGNLVKVLSGECREL